MRPHFLPPSSPELHPDVRRRQRECMRLAAWLVATFVVVAVTFFAIGYLAASYTPSFQPLKVIT